MTQPDLPAVGGRRLATSIAEFERKCLVLISDEQAKANCDSVLVGVLCDAVRLGREHVDVIGRPFGIEAVEIYRAQLESIQRAADRLAGEVCRLIDYEMRLDPRSAAGDALLDYASQRHGDSDPIGDVRRTFNGLPTTKEGRLFPEISFYHKRMKYLESALVHISEGRGRFSRDPQTHADNCIEDMKAVALGAVAGTWKKEE